jgi:hypothetical protein
MRPFHRFLATGAILVCAFLIPCPRATAQLTNKFYYLVGPGVTRPPAPDESFAIEVDRVQAAEIETILKASGRAGFSGTIAAGIVDYNRSYSAPGQPVWNWHVASVTGIFDFSTTLFPACECPFLIARPSDIAADPDEWIRQNGTVYTPIRYAIQRRIDPAHREAIANVSNRGVTGRGERKLITGLIITGGTPRNIVIRVLGPSLASAGVQQAAADPKLELYQDGTRIATNADWKDDPRADSLAQNFPSLVPADNKEAALWVTLFPGNYTVQASNEDGTEGIVLIEAYDVDSSAP